MNYEEIGALAFGLAIGLLIGGCVAGVSVGASCRQQAIEHKAAHYDEATGKFEWNVEVTK